ncbi:MAG TPA: hypothetical protein VED37_09680, partial [Ktedonobacteraceae bacterium]|nr:hypothetical protein [Ktedonobacteraceae bacterium]
AESAVECQMGSGAGASLGRPLPGTTVSWVAGTPGGAGRCGPVRRLDRGVSGPRAGTAPARHRALALSGTPGA